MAVRLHAAWRTVRKAAGIYGSAVLVVLISAATVLWILWEILHGLLYWQ